jgi:hypothetical protein
MPCRLGKVEGYSMMTREPRSQHTLVAWGLDLERNAFGPTQYVFAHHEEIVGL